MDLEQMLKLTGIGMAIIGAVLSSPSGTKHLLLLGKDRAAANLQKVTALLKTLQEELKKLFQPRIEKPPVQKLKPTGIASLEGVGSLTISGYAWSPEADAATRVNQVKAGLDELSRIVNDRFQQAFQSIDAHQMELRGIRRTLNGLHREILERLDNIERKTARVQAHGLPAIALGIAISGIPAELACIPAVGWSACVIGVFIAGACVRSSIRSKAWKD